MKIQQEMMNKKDCIRFAYKLFIAGLLIGAYMAYKQ